MVTRRRDCALQVNDPGATPERLAAYLALVDRPVAALLAHSRTQALGLGRFRYSSNPLRLLQYELVPTLELQACCQGACLHLLSVNCRIVGLGRWADVLTFGLVADLRPGSAVLNVLATVWVALPSTVPGWGKSLAARALEQVLDRMERRLRRGLAKDLLVWLSYVQAEV
ncbi:MAG: DUF1997 domain-containing protein [Cyanobacteria bacterium]|nr:DUF1997 domain-containing protein [Cyanobacteriota bacterium]